MRDIAGKRKRLSFASSATSRRPVASPDGESGAVHARATWNSAFLPWVRFSERRLFSFGPSLCASPTRYDQLVAAFKARHKGRKDKEKRKVSEGLLLSLATVAHGGTAAVNRFLLAPFDQVKILRQVTPLPQSSPSPPSSLSSYSSASLSYSPSSSPPSSPSPSSPSPSSPSSSISPSVSRFSSSVTSPSLSSSSASSSRIVPSSSGGEVPSPRSSSLPCCSSSPASSSVSSASSQAAALASAKSSSTVNRGTPSPPASPASPTCPSAVRSSSLNSSSFSASSSSPRGACSGSAVHTPAAPSGGPSVSRFLFFSSFWWGCSAPVCASIAASSIRLALYQRTRLGVCPSARSPRSPSAIRSTSPTRPRAFSPRPFASCLSLWPFRLPPPLQRIRLMCGDPRAVHLSHREKRDEDKNEEGVCKSETRETEAREDRQDEEEGRRGRKARGEKGEREACEEQCGEKQCEGGEEKQERQELPRWREAATAAFAAGLCAQLATRCEGDTKGRKDEQVILRCMSTAMFRFFLGCRRRQQYVAICRALSPTTAPVSPSSSAVSIHSTTRVSPFCHLFGFSRASRFFPKPCAGVFRGVGVLLARALPECAISVSVYSFLMGRLPSFAYH
ncbi:putative mitochondrial carrier domain-containing protein [Neospora caninum Liverpool]|uniref:Putative mitochondrial carrier domain-containing protein n=1 Tax=Neospora caninum (strain Liverpool) TaxID=572307 RepID=F0VPT9_NEOCL|nr:putative mitochondrial carrier domain-containing protein [Neospora caninum Liverpool]CBZ55736.1 putative mitochondrial carrier domain-containing protein [Neospora caninum Liverpool]|eukprot:XP_003885762.1 putative mitochondrial carrier domain-containing protein [Neospora caninum Liverpool]